MERLSITFTLRSKSSKGLTDVYCRLTIKGERLVYPTGIKVLPTDWSNKRTDKLRFNYCKPTMLGHSDANQKFSDLYNLAQSLYRRFHSDNRRVPTLTELKNLLDLAKGKTEKSAPINLSTFIDQFIERRRTQMINQGKRVTGNTILTTYRQTKRLLKEFGTATRTKIDFDTINLELYQKFIDYMHDVKGFSISNTGKHIKTLKTFMNDALEDGHTDNRSHKSKYFKVTTDESFAIALTDDEIQSIYELDLSNNKGQETQRDAFIVACSTGLRFSDVSVLTKKNIVSKEGRTYIQIKTQKTKEPVAIPIDGRLAEIMDKYKDSERGFPKVFANQIMNRHLKEIGKMIPELHDVLTVQKNKGGKPVTEMKRRYELLTTHTARRSFSTIYYKKGVPIQFIMKITGHRTESAFLKYIRTTPLDDAKVFEMFMNQHSLKVV